MTDFAAIDFETANQCRSSVCSVGVVIVHDGMIVDRFYSLIQPTPNYYTHWTTEIHGLTHNDTDNAPIFPEVWKQINPLIKGLPLVAHNSPFDEGCLRSVFKTYEMEYPEYPFYCTLKLRVNSNRNCPITVLTQSLRLVISILLITTMLLLMQKPVLP